LLVDDALTVHRSDRRVEDLSSVQPLAAACRLEAVIAARSDQYFSTA
jgi:hypothetical protein